MIAFLVGLGLGFAVGVVGIYYALNKHYDLVVKKP